MTEASPPLPAVTCTFGHYTQTTPWADVRTLPWSELTILLTRHEAGPKEGSGIVPATFSGTRRHKADAQRIDVAFLDSDAGATLQEITAAIGARGWAAVVSSTHSHLTTRTRAKRGNWDRFRAAAAATDEDVTPAGLPGNREGLSAGDRRGRARGAGRGGIRHLRAPALPKVPHRHPAAAALDGCRLR